MDEGTNWKRSFKDYKQALANLKDHVELAGSRKLTTHERQGAIQHFDTTITLAHDVMTDYLANQGIIGINESGETVHYAFDNNLIEDKQVWIDMINEHKLATEANGENNDDDFLDSIVNTYYSLFTVLAERIDELEK
ncbi:MAG: nucleotidyltransferase substrate binding protein [Treponema sp.]|nr:nucleotidyltransferase substrate binding protein [Treponema sp.]